MNSIEWHENILANKKRSYKQRLLELESSLFRLNNLGEEIYFSEIQIKEAKRMKKPKFDAERFLKKKENAIKAEARVKEIV